MKLDGRFMFAEFRPPEDFQTQLNRAGIQRIDHVVQFDSGLVVSLEKQSGFVDQHLGKVRIDLPASGFIGISQRRFANSAGQSHMI